MRELVSPLDGFRSPFGVSSAGGTSPASVYLETFPATSGVNSSLYGPQSSSVQKLNASTGARIATTYVDLQGTDHYNFLRDLIVHNSEVLILGQSRLGANAQSTEVSIATMSKDLSTLYDTWSCGETANAPGHDGQPALVSDGTNIWAAFTVDSAIDATGSSGGFDTTFNASLTSRLVVCKFSIDGSYNLTLENHTYIQDVNASPVGSSFGETHCITLNADGNVMIAGEVFQAFKTLEGEDYRSYDGTGPAQRKGFVMEIAPDLSAVEYASFFGPSGASDDCYFDGIAVDGDGNYCMAMMDANEGVFTTDGSTHPDVGENTGLLVVFDRWHQILFSSYINDANTGSYQSAVRRAAFDPNGNIYVGGWQGKGGPNSPTARMWRFSKASGNLVTRAVNDDSTLTSETLTNLGVTNGLGFEIKYTPNLEQNSTIFAVGASNAAKLLLTHAGAGTALSAFLWFDGGTADNAGSNALVAGTEYTLRAIWDGSTGEAQLYVTGGAYATETLLCERTGITTPFTFTGSDVIEFLAGVDSSFDDLEYMRVWYSATTSGTPDMEFNAANCVNHRWDSGAVAWSPDAAAYSEAWELDFPTSSSGAGQIRGIWADASNVYATGGIDDLIATPDFTYNGTGGTGGSSAFKMQGFAVKVNAAGTEQWFTQWGDTAAYFRCYALVVDGSDVYIGGRGADTLVTGYA